MRKKWLSDEIEDDTLIPVRPLVAAKYPGHIEIVASSGDGAAPVATKSFGTAHTHRALK